MESWIDLVLPFAMRTGHDVQVVQIKAWSGSYDVVALGHQHQVSIMDSNRFIETMIRVDTLEGETIGWLQAVVVCLLQVRLVRRVFRIVFMRGKRGPVASRSDHLDEK